MLQKQSDIIKCKGMKQEVYGDMMNWKDNNSKRFMNRYVRNAVHGDLIQGHGDDMDYDSENSRTNNHSRTNHNNVSDPGSYQLQTPLQPNRTTGTASYTMVLRSSTKLNTFHVNVQQRKNIHYMPYRTL